MACLKLRYRNSFIDVDEEVPSPKRASSLPATTRESSFLDHGLEEEISHQSYVENLAPKLQTLRANAEPAQEPQKVNTLRISGGSLGHPEVCRRQCIYFLQGNCNNGDDCAYCHLPHPGKAPKLDKRQRQLMAALTRPELFALILHLTSVRAEEMGMLIEAQEVIAILESEAGATVPSMDDRETRALRKTLARMSFSSLIGTVSCRQSDGVDSLSTAMERMRQMVADVE